MVTSNSYNGGVAIKRVIGGGPGYTTVEDMDGNVLKIKGTVAWRANNPGNLRPGSWTNDLGAIGITDTGSNGKFLVFPDRDTGLKAQEALQFENPNYANKTIGEAIKLYAPKGDHNDPVAYAQALANALGVSVDTKMSALTPEQRAVYMQAQHGVENNSVGKVINMGTSSALDAINGMAPLPFPMPPAIASAYAAEQPPAPPLPRPRPTPPTAPAGTPWDIPGLLNVSREMALKPDASGHYPTMASGYINRAIDKAMHDAAPVIQQKAADATAAATSTMNSAKDAATNFGASINLGSIGSMFGNLFGGSSPPAVPSPPANWRTPSGPHIGAVPTIPPDMRAIAANAPHLGTTYRAAVPSYGTPGYSGRDVAPPPSNWLPSAPVTPPSALSYSAKPYGLPGFTGTYADAPSSGNYGLPGYSGNDVAPGSLPLPAPPPLVPPILSPTLPTAPLVRPMTPGTPPGTPLHMTTVPFVPPPPPPVRIASGKTAQVGATGSAQGGRYQYQVQPDGSIKNLTTGRITAPATR